MQVCSEAHKLIKIKSSLTQDEIFSKSKYPKEIEISF